MTLTEIISIIADFAIIFLLAVQSYVLWILKKPILNTAKNSEYYKKLFGGGKPPINRESPTQTNPTFDNFGVYLNCKFPFEPNHIHTDECK